MRAATFLIAGCLLVAFAGSLGLSPYTGLLIGMTVQGLGWGLVETVINPLTVNGQAHGGIVQGIGQALREHVVYDQEGQLLTGSYMDYAMPRADDAPLFTHDFHPVPAKTNVLGAKGCGEAGCAGALPSVMNALVDALSEYGIRHIDMPATPERVWRAISEARKSAVG